MVEGGYWLDEALRRTARAQGLNLQQARPSLEALHGAIREHRELFRPQQQIRLQELRRLALEAMHSVAEFRPRLMSPLIHGDGPLDRVRLILTCDTPEQVMMHLHDRHIPWREAETTLHYSGNRRIARPALHFMAGDTAVELVLLDESSRSDPPRDPVTGGRLETLDADQLTQLVGAAEE